VPLMIVTGQQYKKMNLLEISNIPINMTKGNYTLYYSLIRVKDDCIIYSYKFVFKRRLFAFDVLYNSIMLYLNDKDINQRNVCKKIKNEYNLKSLC
jgi:hypothetical protein